MPAPPAYLDENVDHALAGALHERGFAVATARNASMLGADDETQLAYASAQDMMILTHNRRHFQRWHQLYMERGQVHAGVIVLPQSNRLPLLALRAAMMLDWIATLGDHRSRLFSWGTLQELLERGFRLPGYSENDVRMAVGR